MNNLNKTLLDTIKYYYGEGKKVHSVTSWINAINIVFVDEYGYYTVGSLKLRRRR